MRQQFEIPGRLDGLNEYTNANRGSWSSGRDMKRDNQEVVGWAIKAAKLKPMAGRIAVTITWVEGLKPGAKQFRPRDRDNIAFAKKFIMDALVEQGVIKDDSWNRVVSYTDLFRINRENPRIIVEIEEI